MFFKLKMKPASAKDETSTNYIKSSRPFKIEKGLNSINSAKKNYVKTDIAMYHPKKKLFFSVPKNQSNNYELQQNNKCLFDRINNIYKRGDRRMEQLMKPGFEKNKKHNSGYKKLEILYLAQDNLTMLKRLTEKTSFYNFNRWEKEYEKSQYYKRTLCAYPSIDFYKTQRAETFGNKFPMIQNGWYKSKTSYGLFENRKKKTFENFNYKDLEAISNKNNSHAKTMEAEKNEEKKEKKEENKENKESKEIGESKRKDENNEKNNNEKEGDDDKNLKENVEDPIF